MKPSWLLQSVFLSFSFLSSNAAPTYRGVTPSRILPRADSDPGIGVELECRGFLIKNKDPRAEAATDDATLALVKGKKLIVDGQKTFADEWMLTAEHSGTEAGTGIGSLTFEWIVDGTVVKLDSDDDTYQLPGIMTDIKSALEAWQPVAPNPVSIDDFPEADWGVWAISTPTVFNKGAISFGMQVTAPMPMDGIQGLISSAWNGKNGNSPLLPSSQEKTARYHLVEKAELDSLDVIDSDDITDDLLGFFSLLVSYAKGTKFGIRDIGPKQSLTIMPRTNFVKIYSLVVKDKFESGKKCRSKDTTTLWDVISQLATIGKSDGKEAAFKSIDELNSAKFIWPAGPAEPAAPAISSAAPPPPPPPPPPAARRSVLSKRSVDTNTQWDTRSADIAAGELLVKTWIDNLDNRGVDLVSVMDATNFDGQIGKLTDRTENNLYHGDQPLPIFEFRDIESVAYDAMESMLQAFEGDVKVRHKHAVQAEPVALRKRKSCKPKLPKCSGNQVPGPSGLCVDCGKGTKPNDGNKACVWDDSGCMADEVSTMDKGCQKCADGEEPDATGKTCQKKGDTDGNDKKGKCPDGHVLDPVQGSQDATTENPVCLPDDDAKCAAKGEGQIAATRRKNVTPGSEDYEPECSTDDDPDHRCDDPNTYDHKISKDGKISHSCRSTRKAESDKKAKYNERVQTAIQEKTENDKKKQDEDNKLKEEEKGKKKRARCGTCFAIMAGAAAWEASEIAAMTTDEIDGLVNIWPDDNIPAPEGYIADYMVNVGERATIGPIEMEGGGVPLAAIVSSVFKAFASLGNAAAKAVSSIRAGTRIATEEVINAAKYSATVGKIIKDPRFLDCVSSTALIAATEAIPETPQKNFQIGDVTVDYSRTNNGINPIPDEFIDRQLVLKNDHDTGDWTDSINWDMTWGTYPDTYSGRLYRLRYEQCQSNPINDQTTALEVSGGCCAFYSDDGCTPGTLMFTMQDRQDHKLKGDDNDSMSSFWCTFQHDCAGAPGLVL